MGTLKDVIVKHLKVLFLIQESTCSFTIVLKNVGTTSVYLKKCLPLRDMNAFTFSDQFGCTRLNNEYNMQEIMPGTNLLALE